MYAKRLKRKCSVRGCKNTDTFAISRTRELGGSVIICKSCLGKALGVIDDINPETGSNIKVTTGGEAPTLFFNAKALGKTKANDGLSADVATVDETPTAPTVTEPQPEETPTPVEPIAPEDPVTAAPEEQTEPEAPEAPEAPTPTEEQTATNETSGFVCPNCGRSFDTEQGLKTHLRFCKEKSDE